MRELRSAKAFHFYNFVISFYNADLSFIILCLNLLRFQNCEKFQLEENKSFLTQNVESRLYFNVSYSKKKKKIRSLFLATNLSLNADQ